MSARRKTTLFLPAEEYRVLQELARQQRRPAAELVRKAVVEYTQRHAKPAAPKSLGLGRSRDGDLSERAEELLIGFGEP
jgi:hypothetical protein